MQYVSSEQDWPQLSVVTVEAISAHRCKASRRGCILSALKGRLAQARLDYGMLLTQPPRH